ncbi:uncharacterized protein LOC114351013 isoform X2 [Ostrinia furnacalis]|uniref:uncharacterized protein LOC114351013 isoform X2 n=1 Tax=Ostrinia furnacalis TaxID=93504 RepID=UPI00103D6C0D|nr:uncharacterized protein LOC114351013 isoform X2 [Ostrinia furnacalis]
MADWSNKHVIMRDLAEAQGCDVPVDLEGIGANEKPPALNIPEDMGEDYFGHCIGEGDTGPPDIAMIQQMLDEVRDVSVLNCEDSSEYVVEISKPNRLSMSQLIGKDVTNTRTGAIPKTVQSKTEKPAMKKVKKKRENVAVNSILQNMAEESAKLNAEQPKEPLKLLKPMDFITDLTDTEIVQSVEKVNGWLDNQVPETYVPKFVSNPLHFEAGSMFKRKSGSTSKSNRSDSVTSSPQKKESSTSYKPSSSATKTQDPERKILHNPLALDPGAMFKRRSGSTSKSTGSDSVETFSPPQKPPTSSVDTYQPTTNFNEYYQKYVEKSQIKESIKEDIWTRAEKLMKKKEEAAALKALESNLEAEAIVSEVFDVPTEDDIANIVLNFKLEPDVIDSTVETDVIDTMVEPDVMDATIQTVVNDATIQTAVNDATIQPAVTETTREPAVMDVPLEPVLADATIQPAINDATIQTAVTDATIQPVVTETTRQPAVMDVPLVPVVADATIQPAVIDATIQPAEQ